jgi:hypothetical protein
MEKKIFEDVIVTISSGKSIKKLWIEEQLDDNNRPIKYKICKNIQYKDFPELNISSDKEEIKN